MEETFVFKNIQICTFLKSITFQREKDNLRNPIIWLLHEQNYRMSQGFWPTYMQQPYSHVLLHTCRGSHVLAPAQDVISSFGLNIFNILQIGESMQVQKNLLIDFLYYEGTHGRKSKSFEL